MKKLLLLTALLCGALCTSCVKEITSLDGTTWTNGNSKLVFTSTDVTYTAVNGSDFTGTYTYDPPTVTITATVQMELGTMPVDMTGTIRKKTMHIGIKSGDMIMYTDLEMQ